MTRAGIVILLVGWIASHTAAETWHSSLPASVREQLLWSAGMEAGNLNEWTDADFKSHGGGVFNTGGEEVLATSSRDVAHTGNWSAKTTIRGALRAANGPRAVRLMRWTNKAWDDHGAFFPEEAYYSTWAYFPHIYNPNKSPPWDPGDGGWWNIFQFKGPDAEGQSQPIWTVNVGYSDRRRCLYLYLYSPRNQPSSYQQTAPAQPLPIRQWVHLEAFYRTDTETHGQITFWQNGEELFNVSNVVTSLGGKSGTDRHVVWGIGSYTDHIVGDPAGDGIATVYFDDAAVSKIRLSQFLPVLDVARP